MLEDLKLPQIGFSLRCRLHSGDFTLPEYENTLKLSLSVISGNRLLSAHVIVFPPCYSALWWFNKMFFLTTSVKVTETFHESIEKALIFLILPLHS